MNTFDFNPNDPGVPNGNYFALPVETDQAQIVLLSVPWDVTTSYQSGTSNGPEAILNASAQVDLFDENIPRAWEIPLGTLPFDDILFEENKKSRAIAEKVIERLSEGEDPTFLKNDCEVVNLASQRLNEYVYHHSSSLLKEGKIVGVVGGEHSVPLGLIKALGEKYCNFGILHIDAHADLRECYEGFKYSHASIMYNVLCEVPQVSALCQVGVRDYCEFESRIIANDDKIRLFSDSVINDALYSGDSWRELTDRIIDSLPEHVYISFDIDGLSPLYCPNTGTPVPGGLSFNQAEYLLRKLANSGKKIIGFDLCEVAPGKDGEWDANVGARILFKLCLFTFFNRLK